MMTKGLLFAVLAVSLVVCVQGQWTDFAQLPFYGNEANCTECLPGRFFSPFYSCSQDEGWTGRAAFEDPIPSYFLLTKVDLVIVGLFNCKNEQLDDQTLVVSLNDFSLSLTTMPTQPNNCNCPSCGIALPIQTTRFPSGIPGYQYDSYNFISVDLADEKASVCVDYVNVTFYYEPATPFVEALVPAGGPIVGKTKVKVAGSDFNEYLNYTCQFGSSAPVKAVFLDTFHLECEAPAVTSAQDVFFTLTVLATGQVVDPGLMFSFYDEPVLSAVDPNFGPEEGGALVTVHSTSFAGLSTTNCVFGDTFVPAIYVNTSIVQCISTKGTGETSLDISQNGQQKTGKPLKFLFMKKPTLLDRVNLETKERMPAWGWAVIGLALFTFIIVAVSYTYYMKRTRVAYQALK